MDVGASTGVIILNLQVFQIYILLVSIVDSLYVAVGRRWVHVVLLNHAIALV